MTSFQELKAYAHEVIEQFRHAEPLTVLQEPGCRVEVLDVANGYQICRFVYEPGVRIESHAHPDSESVQFYDRGSVTVWSKGHSFTIDEATTKSRASVIVPRGLSHGAEIGPHGLTILSVERHYGQAEPVIGCPHAIWKTHHGSTVDARRADAVCA